MQRKWVSIEHLPDAVAENLKKRSKETSRPSPDSGRRIEFFLFGRVYPDHTGEDKVYENALGAPF